MSIPEVKSPQPSRMLDEKGRLLATVSGQNRIPVPIDQVSPFVLDAIVAIEDSRFYKHYGIDPVGLARAAYRNIRAGEVVEGGSTITQQLAKNLYLGPERTVGRKLKEIVLTIQLEKRYSKTEILEMYLNQIYFGQGAYGIEMASRTYFDKPARDLNLAESAMLAGIPRAPSVYAPTRNYKAARERQALVLRRMADLGYITPEQSDSAIKKKIITRKAVSPVGRAAFLVNLFTAYVRDKHPELEESILAGGYDIETTMNIDLQDAAERTVRSGLEGKDPGLEAALVAIDPAGGQVKAMVGSRNPGLSSFNRATARSQPGSAFKPFLYAAAVENGYTAATTVDCEPVSYPQPDGTVYSPQDYGGGYHGRSFTLKEALIISDNVVTIRLAEMLGPDTLSTYARSMGVKSRIRPYLSLALGTSEVTPLEMASAYSTLANRGVRSEPYFINRIIDPAGRVIEENFPVQERAIDEKTAYIITDMLSGVLEPGGTAQRAGEILQRPAAGKTGTTENYKEAWFVGYTPDLTTAVYIGYDQKNKVVGETGGAIAAPIWADFMSRALEHTPVKDFTMPPGVVKKKICREEGLLALQEDHSALEAAFVEGTEPQSYCMSGFSGFPGIFQGIPYFPELNF